MQDFTIVTRDGYPSIAATLSDGDGVVNISGATVDLVYKLRNGDTPITGSAVIVSSSGEVRYDLPSTGIANGVYKGRWRVTFSNSREESFPNDRFLLFEIMERL